MTYLFRLLQCHLLNNPVPIAFFNIPECLVHYILEFLNPDYLTIAESLKDTKIKTLHDYRDIFLASMIAKIVCRPTIYKNELDAHQYVYKILKQDYYINTRSFLSFTFRGGKKCKIENVVLAFRALNLRKYYVDFYIPRFRDITDLYINNYLRDHFFFENY